MKFTVTFIGLVVIGIIALFVFMNNGGKSESKDINQVLSEATQSAQITQTGQEETGTYNINQQGQMQQQNQTQINPIQGELKTAQTATIKTTKGTITLTLYPDVAPKTVSNFVTKAQSGFYKNLTFHRVETWVIQGGDPKGDGTGGGNMPVEFNSKPFVKGSLGVARTLTNNQVQNDSQFFITKSDASWLNGQYTNFGIVTNGIDVVNKIQVNDKILSITVQ